MRLNCKAQITHERAIGLLKWVVGMFLAAVVGLAAAQPLSAGNAITTLGHTYPRLFAMQIGEPDYHLKDYQDAIARFDVVVLGFFPGWERLRTSAPMRDAVAAVKARNPQTLIGQYTIMNESRDERHKWAASEVDRIDKLNEQNWWLRDARGRKVQRTSEYGHWDVNFTSWTRPDADGRRFPQWLAQRDYRIFFRDIPGFSIWYVDNVMKRPPVRADWNLDGLDDSPDDARVQQAFRAGYSALWEEIRRLHPGVMIMANTDTDLSEPEYRAKVEGAFLEGLMGKEWSLERRRGWSEMMKRYRAVKSNLRHPALVGFNVWGDSMDFRFFRYAFGSCLLDDGFFSFTDVAQGYSGAVWFDEYDLNLGTARTTPPNEPWQNGVWRRDFQNGIVLVNPTSIPAVVLLEKPFKRLTGQQDKLTNNGATTSKLIIPGKDGLILERLP